MTDIICPKCGAIIESSESRTHGICPYCDSEFLLDPQKMKHVEKMRREKFGLKNNYLDIIRDICVSHKFDGENYIYFGESLKKKRVFKKIQKYFLVPKEDDAYFICDTTVLGTRKLGFALCDSGIFYCENKFKKCGKIEWLDFKELKIYAAGKDYLFIGEHYFEVFSDAQKVNKFLKIIQSEI